MFVKAVIIVFLLVILYTLGSSFYFMVKDKGDGDRALKRLMCWPVDDVAHWDSPGDSCGRGVLAVPPQLVVCRYPALFFRHLQSFLFF